MDREAWQATVHGVGRVRHDLVTQLSLAVMNTCQTECTRPRGNPSVHPGLWVVMMFQWRLHEGTLDFLLNFAGNLKFQKTKVDVKMKTPQVLGTGSG